MTASGQSKSPATQRRGKELRLHILYAAKDVFLESGYERTSMDLVAARAKTSKRSLYTFFDNKDTLFLAIVELVRELYLGKLKTPDAYADEPSEAVARFCGRFLQLMVWESQVRTCRLLIAEADRLPESARMYYEAIFQTAHARLATFLAERCGCAADSSALSADLLARTVLPRLTRALLGVDDPIPGHDVPADTDLATDVDLGAIRALVASVVPDR